VLFPLVRRMATDPGGAAHCGSIRNPVSVMLVEHDLAGELLDRLHTLTGAYTPPPDGCASYRSYYAALAELAADTHLHVHKENNVLFPAVVALEGVTRAGTDAGAAPG
jgi:regulator of cell morphogenesis and NO signaling